MKRRRAGRSGSHRCIPPGDTPRVSRCGSRSSRESSPPRPPLPSGGPPPQPPPPTSASRPLFSPPCPPSRSLVLTPCPPLPTGEGERCAISERSAQQRCQVLACHIAVRNADHSIPRGLEGYRARGIVRPSFPPRVRRALKLEH